MDIPLRDSRSSNKENQEIRLFSKEKMIKWQKEAELFNSLGKGDQAVIYLAHQK